MRVPRFTLRGFKRPREAVAQTLGSLERRVMEIVWSRGTVSVRAVHNAFGEETAYTTVMTTLDRLYKKGLLDRSKEGRAFRYTPRLSRQELEHGVARDVIEGLLGESASGTRPVLACIVDAVTDRDRELLDELDRLVRQKRRFLSRRRGPE
jgi:predicted transcriptional regulator